MWKDPDAGKDWRQEEKGTTEDGMVRWHHRLSGQWVCINSRSWWWTGRPVVLAVYGVTKSWTRLSNWTELNWIIHEPWHVLQISSVLKWSEVKVAQLCPTATSWTVVHGNLQVRILECIAVPSSRGSSQPRGRTQVLDSMKYFTFYNGK